MAAVFVFFAALSAVDGGLTGLVTTLVEDDPEAVSPWGTLGMMGSLSWFVVFVLGSAGQPHVITKFMMNRRVEDARRHWEIFEKTFTNPDPELVPMVEEARRALEEAEANAS